MKHANRYDGHTWCQDSDGAPDIRYENIVDGWSEPTRAPYLEMVDCAACLEAMSALGAAAAAQLRRLKDAEKARRA